MSLDFFRADCQYPPIALNTFGLCDCQDGTKAFPDTDVANRDSKWIAEVINVNNLQIVFTAIDKCVLQDYQFNGRGRCDGMLTTTIHLYLVELKNQEPPWQTNAIDQLDSTIQFLTDNHDISQYKKRKVFACNKKRDKFVVIENEFNKAFYKRTTFRIDIQAEIVVI
jgi:hypothetical protein